MPPDQSFLDERRLLAGMAGAGATQRMQTDDGVHAIPRDFAPVLGE